MNNRKALAIVFILLVAAIAVLSYFAVMWTDDQQITDIQVDGDNKNTSELAVRGYVSGIANKSIGSVDFDSIAVAIKSEFPYTKKVEVYRSGISEVTIDIEEAKPVAFLIETDIGDSEKEVSILVEGGNKAEYKVLDDISDKLPVLMVESLLKIDSLTAKSLTDIAVKISQDADLNIMISEINYSDVEGISIVLNNGITRTYLGRRKIGTGVLNTLKSFWVNYVIGNPNAFKTIDLRWGTNIVTT
ncbi:MAG: hypothetical protein Kapaf2KO_17880 [Candidatus Kapaibacteriales bacterium]